MKQTVNSKLEYELTHPERVANAACEIFGKEQEEKVYFLGLTHRNAVSAAFELEHTSFEDFISNKELLRGLYRQLLLCNASYGVIVVQKPTITNRTAPSVKVKDAIAALRKELALFDMDILDIVIMEVCENKMVVHEAFSYAQEGFIEIGGNTEMDGMVLRF